MLFQAIRFDQSPKVYIFETTEIYPLQNRVVVRSKRGLELGLVRSAAIETQDDPKGVILRTANDQDLQNWQKLKEQAEEIKWFLRGKSKKLKLNIKIAAVQFVLDENFVTVMYSSEQKIDLAPFLADLARMTPAKVHFQSIDAREQAQVIGTLGFCGTENCSSHHLQDFSSVTIKMARDQQLPLNHQRISGPCGRLLCCLQYEHQMYRDLSLNLPSKGTKVCKVDGNGCGVVIRQNPLREVVDILADEGGVYQAKKNEIKVLSGKN